jgi:hypothetical protein
LRYRLVPRRWPVQQSRNIAQWILIGHCSLRATLSPASEMRPHLSPANRQVPPCLQISERRISPATLNFAVSPATSDIPPPPLFRVSTPTWAVLAALPEAIHTVSLLRGLAVCTGRISTRLGWRLENEMRRSVFSLVFRQAELALDVLQDLDGQLHRSLFDQRLRCGGLAVDRQAFHAD